MGSSNCFLTQADNKKNQYQLIAPARARALAAAGGGGGRGGGRGAAAAAARQAALAAGGGSAAPATPAAAAGGGGGSSSFPAGGPGGFGSGSGYVGASGFPAGFGSPTAVWGRGGGRGPGSRGRFPSAGQLAGMQSSSAVPFGSGVNAHSSGQLQQYDSGGGETFGVRRVSGRGGGNTDRGWGEGTGEEWTEGDFVEAVRLYGRDFKAISRHLGMRTLNTAKMYYYKSRVKLDLDQVGFTRMCS